MARNQATRLSILEEEVQQLFEQLGLATDEQRESLRRREVPKLPELSERPRYTTYLSNNSSSVSGARTEYAELEKPA